MRSLYVTLYLSTPYHSSLTINHSYLIEEVDILYWQDINLEYFYISSVDQFNSSYVNVNHFELNKNKILSNLPLFNFELRLIFNVLAKLFNILLQKHILRFNIHNSFF